VKGKEKYEAAGKMTSQDWSNTPSSHLFPRMWDGNNDRNQVDCYRQYTGLGEDETPTMKDNLKYAIGYQAYWMYLRYFMWNFAGRQNDQQGPGGITKGNWISGIKFIDAARLGPQDKLPQTMLDNKARNTYFLLPLILGIIGLIFHYNRSQKDFFIVMLLFILNTVYHMWIGMQEIILDYVHEDKWKFLSLMANTFFVFAVGFASAFAVLKLSFGV